jgi:broad specificity phosphatase PhoE
MSDQPLLYIVRHGATGTGDDQYNSPENPELSEEGIAQAEEAGKFLSDRLVGGLYTSGLKRAKESADIIGKAIHRIPMIDESIHSLDVGDVANMADNDEADRVMKHHQSNPDKPLPGGESIRHFQDRVQPALMRRIEHYYQTGVPDIDVAHHSVQHEAGNMFNGNRDSALSKPGGVVAVYQDGPGKFRAVPIFKPEERS